MKRSRRGTFRGVARVGLAVALALGLLACPEDAPAPRQPWTARPVLGDWLFSVTAGETAWGFYLYLPDDHGRSSERYPLLVYLRGWGNFGWPPNPPLLSAGPLAPLRKSDRELDPAGRGRLDPRVRRAVVVVPRLPYFDPGYHHPLGSYHPDTIQELIDWVSAHYRVDRSRIYLTGASDGGGGVWAFAAAHPETPAAVVPIACALRVPATPGLREVPIWMFHNFDDDHEENSDPAFRAVTGARDFLRTYPHAGGDPGKPAAGDCTISFTPGAGLGPWRPGVVVPSGRVTYTVYAAPGHDAWTRTYANPEMWRWLFAQRRQASGRPPGPSTTPAAARTDRTPHGQPLPSASAGGK